MWTAAAILAAIGVALLAYVKVNDRAEAYDLILPGIIGVVCLIVAAVCAIAARWGG